MTRANPTPRRLDIFDLSLVSMGDSIHLTAEERHLLNSLALQRLEIAQRELGLKKPAAQ